MSTPNYDIDYNDKRLTDVESDKNAALKKSDATYDGMISNSDKYFQSQIDASKEWANTQKELQQEQTDFAIEQIGQQKAQAKQDYTKEQSGAYVDWQKQSNQYGVNAEQMAAQGMQNSGFSESSQVSMYNTYQNRVVAAREAFQRATLNYDNAIKDARLKNNAALAEIAYQALQQQLELSLQGFQYKNTLVLEKANKRTELEQIYHSRYQDVLKQINTENALAEEVRQYNETLAEQKRQHNDTMAFQREQFNWQKQKYEESKSSSGSSGAASGAIKKGVGGSSKKKSGSSSSIAKQNDIITGQKKPTSSEPEVDMSSVLALGYGPISASTLNRLISQGKVKEYEENGKLKYKKVVNKQEMLGIIGG